MLFFENFQVIYTFFKVSYLTAIILQNGRYPKRAIQESQTGPINSIPLPPAPFYPLVWFMMGAHLLFGGPLAVFRSAFRLAYNGFSVRSKVVFSMVF